MTSSAACRKEAVSPKGAVRAMARAQLRRGAVLTCKEKKAGSDADSKYRVYHAFRTPLGRVQPHQVLAINRGESQKVLSADVQVRAGPRLEAAWHLL